MGWLDQSRAFVPSATALVGRSWDISPHEDDPFVTWSTTLLRVVHELLRSAYLSQDLLGPPPSSWFGDRAPEREPRALVEVSVGFLHPELESDNFGVALSGSRGAFEQVGLGQVERRLRDAGPLDLTRFARLLGGGTFPSPILEAVELIASIWRQDIGVEPSVLRRDSRQRLLLHCDAIGFGGASAASLVRIGSDNLIAEIGCAHVLPGAAVGDDVLLGTTNTGRLVHIDRQVDLALVERDCNHQLEARPLQRWPAQWMPCTLSGNVSSTNTARIAQVTNSYGVFTDPGMPVWLDLDEAGQPGDSGAAVTDNSSGLLCGIYQGELVDPRGLTFGRCIHIQHAEGVLGVEFVHGN